MAFQEGKKELVCPACAARHSVHWYRLPISERQVVKCLSCDEVMLSGKGPIEYERLTLLKD